MTQDPNRPGNDYTPGGHIQREGDWGHGAGDQRPPQDTRPLSFEERNYHLDEAMIEVVNNAPRAFKELRADIASAAVNQNFTVGAASNARESVELNSVQAVSIALAAEFLANTNPAQTLLYAAQRGMPVGTTEQRNAVRFEAAEDALKEFLARPEYARLPVQDVTELVTAAIPIAEGIVRSR